MAGIKFDFTADNKNLIHAVEQVSRNVQQMKDTMEKSGMSIEKMFSRIQMAATASLAGFSVKEFVQKVAQVRGEFQQLEVAFTTMLGSMEKANTLMKQLTKTAAITPFGLQDVANGAKQLLAYGTAAEEVNDTLIHLGDIAAGLSLPLNDLVMLYGTTMTQGRMFTQDLRQFMGRGIPLADELAKQFGVTKDKVGELVTAGKVGAAEFNKAIMSMSSEGGRFAGLMEAQSKTITGQISNIEDAIDVMFNEIGKQSEGIINAGLEMTSALIEDWEAIGTAILAAATAYGSYKAVLMSMTAFDNAAIRAGYDAEIAALEQLLPLKEQENASDLVQAVADGKLTSEKAAQIAVLRQEAEAHLQLLTAKEAEAKAALNAATSEAASASVALDAAQEQYDAMQQAYDQAVALGDAKNIETAAEKLNTAEMELNTASSTYNSASKKVNAASTELEAASKAKNTAATQLETAANAGDTVATGLLTKAKLALKMAVDAVNASLAKSPLMWIAVAVAGVTYAVYKLVSALNETDEAQERFNDTVKKTQAEMAAEEKKVDSLFDKLRNAEKGTNEYKEVKDAILNQYGKYLSGLSDEIRTLNDVEGAYKAVAAAARDAALARGKEAALSDANSTYGQAYAEYTGKIYDALKESAGEENAKNALRAIKADLKLTGKVAEDTEKAILRVSNGYVKTTWIGELNKAERQLADANERVNATFGEQSSKISNTATKAKNLGEAYSEAETKWKNAQKWLDTITKNRNDYTIEELHDAEESLKSAKEAFEKAGGDPDGKQAKKTAAAASKAAKEDAAERQKEYDLAMKQREEQAKKVQAAENALAAAEIAATRNAAERDRKERENQHRLALQQIDDEEEEMKKRQVEAMRARWEAQKENKDKAWADTETAKDIAKNGYANIVLPEEDIKLLEARRKQVNEEWKREQHDTAEALIREYQSYTDRKEAIDEKYREATESINAEIVKAQERGDQQAVDALRRSLAEAAKERAKGQAQLSLEQLKETPEYVRAFEDLGNTSSETLEMLIGMFEEAKEAAAQSMNPEQLREFTSTLQQMYDEIDRRDPFKAMARSSKEASEAHDEVVKAEKRLALVQKGVQIPIAEKLDVLTGKITQTYLSEEQATKEVAAAKDKEIKTRNKHSKAVKATKDEIEDLANSIRGLGDAMGGIGGEILNIIGDVMSVTMGVMNAVEITSKTAAESISTVEKASVILAVISAALQVVMKIAEVAKGLLGFDDGEQFEKAKQSYEALSDVWDELIEKKREYLDESWGKEAKAATQEIIRLLEAEQKQAEILARQRLDVTNGSHSMWYRMWQGSYKSNIDDNIGALNEGVDLAPWVRSINWRDVNKAIEQGLREAGLGDVTFNAMEDMLTFTSEQLDWIKTNYTGLWTAMDDDFRELLEKHASLTGDMEEAIKAMQERMTGTTAENVIEDFMETLYEFADGSADVMEEVADNWQQMVNRMAVNTLVTQELKERLTKWYENLAKIEEDYTSGIIDETTYRNRLNAAQTEYNSTLDETHQRMTTLQEMGVIKPIEETAKEISEVFDSIRDAWASAVTGMKEDSESLGKEIARIMFEQLVKSNVLNKDFDDWLKNWVSRYEAALNVKAPGEREGQLRQLEEERKNKIHALTEATKAYADAAGYAAEEDSEFTNSLDNLGDTLLNALLDTETDAAEMGRQMGMTLIKEMLGEMLAADKYKTQTEAIRQLWQNVLKSENGTFIDAEGVFGVKDAAYTYSDVLKRIADLNNQIAEDDAITTLADQYKLLGENTDKAKSSFEGLRSTLKNSLTDINATTEDFRKQLEKTLVGDLIDRMVLDVPITIGEVDYKSFDEFNEKWNERYLKALAEGNEEAIALLMEELVEARNITAKAAEEYTQRLKEAQKDTTFTDMEGNFVSALMDMDGDINDFANDMKKVIVQRLVESFMVSEKIKPILDDLQETLNYALSNDDKNWTPEQRAEFIESGDANHSGINDYLKDFEGLQDVVKAIMKAIGYKAKETSEEVAGVFDNLGSSIVDSLMEAEGGVDDFMKTLTDTIVRELADSYMATEDMQKKLAEVKKGLEDAVKSGNPARIKEAQQAVRDFYADAEKGAKAYKDALVQVQQEQDTTFKDMSGDFVSALMDMGTTAEDWASQIGRTMAQRIIEQMVVTSQIQPLLDSLQEVFNTAMSTPGATWQSVMGSSQVQQKLLEIKNAFPGMQEMVKSIMEALGVGFDEATEDVKDGFSDLRSAFVSTLTSMEGDAEAFGKSIGDTMRQQMIDKLVDKKYGQTLEQMNDAWAEALEAGDTKKMKEIIDYLEYIYGRIADDKEIKQLTEDLKKVQEQADTTFKDMKDEFVASLMNLDATADDFGQQIGETLVRRIVEKMMVTKYLQPMLDNLQNAVDKAMNAEGATPESVLDDAGVQEMLDRIRVAYPKLAETVSGLLEKVGIVAEDMGESVEESVELPLENLKDTFVGFFTDLEATAEDFGKQIGETLIEEMLQEVMASEYYTGLFDEIRQHWAMALEGEGGYTIDSVTQEILDLEAAMAKDENITSLQEALKKLHEEVDDIAGDSTFKDMSDSWTQMLTNMDASADDWGKEIGRTLVSRMVKELVVTKHLQTYLDAIQKAADDAIEKYGNSEDSMKKIVEAVTPAINDAVKATEQWKPVVDAVNKAFQDIEDTVTETPFDNMRQSFLSSLMDMKADTKDFGDDITKILTEAFINSFVLDKEFDKAVKQWQKRYSEIMGDKTLDNAGRAKQLNDLKRAISDTRASLAEEAKAIHELMGTNNVQDQSAYMNTAQSITYDQADLIGGMMTSLVMGQGEGNEVRKQILATLQAMQNVTTPKTDYGQQIFQRLGYTNDYLRDIRKTAEAMLSSFTDKLNAVIERLS